MFFLFFELRTSILGILASKFPETGNKDQFKKLMFGKIVELNAESKSAKNLQKYLKLLVNKYERKNGVFLLLFLSLAENLSNGLNPLFFWNTHI
jgi:hypothetical protein